MSYWHGTHPLMYKLKQVEDKLPIFGCAETEDLTEMANLLCLIHDLFNNGCLTANIEARVSRYMHECKHGHQMAKDWFELVKYWYDKDCIPDFETQEWYATYWVTTMLECIDFEYESEAQMKAKAELERKFEAARAQAKPEPKS